MRGRSEQEQLGQRMEAAARAKGLKPLEIAYKLGVTPTTVYRWYKGSRPGPGLLEAFAELLEVPVAELYVDQQDIPEAALRMILTWANRVMEGESSVQALRVAGMAVEDLSPLEVSGLIASEAQLRAELSRAAQGGWNALSMEQRANILLALTRQGRDDTTADDPPAPDGVPQPRPNG